MTRAIVVLLLLCAACVGQSSAPVPDKEIKPKKILENSKATVMLATFGPGENRAMHKHERDQVSVYIDGGKVQEMLAGQAPKTEKIEPGEVRYRSGGLMHSFKNEGEGQFRAVAVEFPEPQGKYQKIGTKSRTCAPDKNACVDEKQLFCTDKVCVENVSMAPGSVSIRHTHATDHILIPITDFELKDEVEGKGTVVRKLKSGEVEYIPAGITHQLTNTGKEAARFTVIVWK